MRPAARTRPGVWNGTEERDEARKHVALVLLGILVLFSLAAADPPPMRKPHPILRSVFHRLEAYLSRRLPGEAWITLERDEVVARCRTREFLVHNPLLTGGHAKGTSNPYFPVSGTSRAATTMPAVRRPTTVAHT